MSVIHELREDYRFYRQRHLEYRWWFILLDVIWLFARLLLIAGVMLACWYAINRVNPAISFQENRPDEVPPAEAARLSLSKKAVPELTDERIALLNEIAAGSNERFKALPDRASDNERMQAVEMSFEDLPNAAPQAETVVKVAAVSAQASDPARADPAAEQPLFDAADNAVSSLATAQTVIADRQWVMYQSPDFYTVQIALTVNRKFLVSFAEKLPAHLTSAIYPERLNNNGDVQYSLSVGSFSDEASAEAALASLPTDARRYAAHTRKFDVIQRNIAALNIQ